MPPLRILHVAPYAPDAWAYGGIPRLTGTLTRALGRRGHQVTICSTDACDESSRLTRASGSTDGVSVRVFPNVSNRLAYRHQLFLPIGFRRFMRHHAGDFDVAHLHACRNAPGAIAAHYLHKAGVPYILAPNGTAPRLERKRLTKRLYDVVLGERIVRSAARLLAVTHAEDAQLRRLGIAASSIRVIPNPVDLDEFNASAPAGRFRQRIGIASGRIVLFLGKLTPRKRVDVLAHAVAALNRPDVWLVIAGNDMGAGAPLRALVRDLNMARHTIFTGMLRGGDRLDALKDADVVVYPSQDEIFGLVPMEALLSGTPVIVADDCGCAEIVRLVEGGQVTPVGNASILADAIARVLDESASWRGASARAAVRVRATFSPDVVAAEIERLYMEVRAEHIQ